MGNWDLVSSIGSIISIIIGVFTLSTPVYKSYFWLKKRSINNRVKNFEQKKEPENLLEKVDLYLSDDSNNINNTIAYEKDNLKKLVFYKFNKIICNENDFIIKNSSMKKGTHTFKINSKNEICIEILDDNKINKISIYKNQLPQYFGQHEDLGNTPFFDHYEDLDFNQNIYREKINQNKDFENIVSWNKNNKGNK